MIKKILILLTLFLFSNVKADVINKLIIEGNKRVSKETIKVYGEIEIDKDISEAELNQITNSKY